MSTGCRALTLNRVDVAVPVRACDVGGWTDTWFAGHGRVCSVALGPGVVVSAEGRPGPGRVDLELPSFGARFPAVDAPPEHRLLAAAVDEAGPPAGVDVRLTVRSHVPAGASLGTSAAVVVGLIAAVDALTGEIRSPVELAAAAHRVEVERAGRQSGVQDQLAAAHGGVNLIEVERYPDAAAHPVHVPGDLRRRLADELVHVAYGGGHDSSVVHRQVIDRLEAEGPAGRALDELRALARDAADALEAGDLPAWGEALLRATDVQAGLHPGLLSTEARAIVELARSSGALGWKLNGAGGPGGSISVLCPDPARARALAQLLRRRGGAEVLDLAPAERGAARIAPSG